MISCRQHGSSSNPAAGNQQSAISNQQQSGGGHVSEHTSMPSRSVASSSAGVGALCAVRQALTPIVCSLATRCACRTSGMATPTPAKSWWLAAPRIFVGTPLREKPVSADLPVPVGDGGCYDEQLLKAQAAHWLAGWLAGWPAATTFCMRAVVGCVRPAWASPGGLAHADGDGRLLSKCDLAQAQAEAHGDRIERRALERPQKGLRAGRGGVGRVGSGQRADSGDVK